jgi:hypothetical protein
MDSLAGGKSCIQQDTRLHLTFNMACTNNIKQIKNKYLKRENLFNAYFYHTSMVLAEEPKFSIMDNSAVKLIQCNVDGMLGAGDLSFHQQLGALVIQNHQMAGVMSIGQCMRPKHVLVMDNPHLTSQWDKLAEMFQEITNTLGPVNFGAIVPTMDKFDAHHLRALLVKFNINHLHVPLKAQALKLYMEDRRSIAQDLKTLIHQLASDLFYVEASKTPEGLKMAKDLRPHPSHLEQEIPDRSRWVEYSPCPVFWPRRDQQEPEDTLARMLQRQTALEDMESEEQ